jgi:hypothetical protein
MRHRLLRNKEAPGPAGQGRGETSAWTVSLFVHLLALLVFSLLSLPAARQIPVLLLSTSVPDEPLSEPILPHAFQFEAEPRDEIGASAVGGLATSSESGAVIPPESLDVPSLELDPSVTGLVEAREFVATTSRLESDLNQSVKGAVGVAVAGAEGAIDRITQEILLSLEERKTLVVWFFDQSGSLQSQRAAVNERFERVYEELGVIEAAGNDAFARHDDNPLLTSVVAFGADVHFLLDEPTHDLKEIRSAVAEVAQDDSGIERVFAAMHQAAMRFRKYRTESHRNILFVAFTDEAGDDTDQLDATVALCRRFAIPVYIVGVPAPFGRRESLVKWIDPDPRFDQSPQWGRVNQGPETLLPERLQLDLSGVREAEAPIDSGFGPFALTRLCYETGGIYFTVHPNRRTDRRVSRREIDAYSAHFAAFFDPEIMRRYRPDYVSAQEYLRRVQSHAMRSALVRAAEVSSLETLEQPRKRFVVRSEAAFASELTEAQKAAARLEPTFQQLHQILQTGEAERPREIVPRWQAGFDLALGRVLANKVRAEGYNAMLAKAKRGLKFEDANHNTWQLAEVEPISGGSRLQRDAEQARMYLERVVRDHPGTPWCLIAQRELEQPMGWAWQEDFTPVEPPVDQVANNPNPPNTAPQNDQPLVVAPPPQRRPPPKL